MEKWQFGQFQCPPAGELGYLLRCLCSPLVMNRFTQYLTEIKGPGWNLMFSKTLYAGGRQRLCARGTPPEACSAGRISLVLIGRRASVGGSVSHADWSRVIGAVDTSPCGVWNEYIRQALGDSQSIVDAPVTGSLVCSILFSCRDITWIARSSLSRTVWGTDCRLDISCCCRKSPSIAPWMRMVSVDNRAGVMFGVDLYVPWDAPEALMDVSSAGGMPLRNMPDVIELVGLRDNATESRVLQGRDPRSIRVLVPDCRGLDQNFHDVTIVDMGDLPESHVSMPKLSELIQRWPPALINHMMWRQRELEQMRKEAKGKYRQKHPAPCTFCGALIKCDMYQHVASHHLELAQLWRCPVSWCTVWRGTPQDFMDHIHEAHNVPGEIRKVSLEKLFPPWTVTRLVYTESLTS